MNPTARPSIRPSAVTISGAKLGRRKVTVPSSASVSTTGRTANARRRRSGTISRSGVWSGAGPGGVAPWKQPRSRLVTATASASSATATSMTPLRVCMSSGPTASASTVPSPPPSIIAGPPMPSETFSVATIRSEQPAITALPAKQRPATTAIRGTSPESFAHSAKALVSRAETTG